MVFLDLQVKVESENLDSWVIQDHCEWYFRVKCSQCGNIHSKEVFFQATDVVEMKGGKGTANFVMACNECKRDGYITIHKDSSKKLDLSEDRAIGVIATFDCRNIELIEWLPMLTVNVYGKETRTLFEDINLSELPWCDYDEKSSSTV